MSYEGWTNYETYLIALFIDNNKFFIDNVRYVAERSRNIDKFANVLQLLFERMNPLKDTGNYAEMLYRDLIDNALSDVNWRELAKEYIEREI